MSSLKLKLALVLAFPALLCGSLLGAAEPAPFHLGIDFGGSRAEVLLAPGEPVRLRNQKTGEILVVLATPEPGATLKARIEVRRAMGKGLAESSEVLELAVGQTAKTRSLSSNAEIHLLSTTPAAAGIASEPDLKFPGAIRDRVELLRIEVTPEGGGSIKSLVEDGQFLRIEEWRTGRSLTFRPDVHSSPANMQVFEVLRNPDGSERGEQLLDEADLEIGASSPKPIAKTYLVRILEVVTKSTRAPVQE